ncbi:hypothetical protein NT6N_03070 [Oceaniferula spumae]|uniref:HNH endonuclease n=1 Tax=Oceaniferula spumae TaxID=2979115 RepID=A0AAT9FH10_9BACT
MRRARTEFTDLQKAKIFVRDRATCCFSGVNLWLLDSPLRPGVQTDWVDHVRPSARGGRSSVDNGVCASHTYNAKKRHNSADTFFLFEEGQPTSGYFELFGRLPIEQESRLLRLSGLAIEDWFLNRSLSRVFEGFYDRCYRDRYGSDNKRDFHYWYRAAYRKLTKYQRLAASRPTLEDRGIITRPSPLAGQWLRLRTASSEPAFLTVIGEIYPAYKRNFETWASYFWDCESPDEAGQVYETVMTSDDVCDEIKGCMTCDYRLRQKRGGRGVTDTSTPIVPGQSLPDGWNPG